jgi:hypothetical protein
MATPNLQVTCCNRITTSSFGGVMGSKKMKTPHPLRPAESIFSRTHFLSCGKYCRTHQRVMTNIIASRSIYQQSTSGGSTMNTSNDQTFLTNAVVQLTGEDGNAFAILGRVRRAIIKSNHPELAEVFMQEATAGDYNHLLSTCMRYVSVE